MFEAGQPRFRDRGQIRRERGALRRGDRERADSPALHLGKRRGEVVEHEVNAPADEILHGGRRALVGDVGHVDARHRLEKLAGEVAGAAGAARAEVELARLRFRERDELRDRVGLHRRIHHQDMGRRGDLW